MAIEISLAANGNLLLHLPLHKCQVPLSVAGLAVIRHVLQANAKGRTKLGQDGNPTQHNLDTWLKSPSGQGALQLAGDRKRFAEIKRATDVEVKRMNKVPINLDLDVMDLI
jgi:hypothetical protein